MLSRKVFFALLPAILVLSGMRASAQAHVTENQKTYIYVDAKYGSDGNSGAQNSSLRTIQAAVDRADAKNQNWVGTKIILKPGVYREFVNIGAYRSTSAPMTIEAAVTGTAIIDAADVLSGWWYETGGIYAHGWTPNFGTCAVPSGWPGNIAAIARRTELLFVNGTPLTQVMAESELVPGTFFINESTNRIYMKPPTGTDVSTATVEAAVRRQTLNVSNRTNVVFRGLVFEHAANCINTAGATVNGSSNILFDYDQAMWNNWGGIGIYGTNNVTVQHSVASHNGGLGFMSSYDQNVLFNSDESDYNNWRGAQAALYDWGMGGTKFMFTRNTTVENHFSYRNQAQGLWFDTDNKDITINNATLSENVMAAMQIEADEGPLTLENSHVCSSGAGVNILNSEQLTIKNNAFYNNSGTGIYDGAEIFVAGFAGGHPINDWITGQYYNLVTSGLYLHGNTFENTWGGQSVFGTYMKGNDWTRFATTLSAGTNHWYNPGTSYNFMIKDGEKVNLGGWRSATGTDYSSNWGKPASSPAGACWVPGSSYADFSMSLNRGSIYMSKGSANVPLFLYSYGAGSVHLRVTGLPSGVWSSLSQNDLASGTVTLHLGAANWVGYKTVPITIWANSGSRVHTITVYVNVTPS